MGWVRKWGVGFRLGQDLEERRDALAQLGVGLEHVRGDIRLQRRERERERESQHSRMSGSTAQGAHAHFSIARAPFSINKQQRPNCRKRRYGCTAGSITEDSATSERQGSQQRIQGYLSHQEQPPPRRTTIGP